MDVGFKKSVIGFDKKQVLDYIEQLNRENQQMSNDLMDQISQIEGERDQLQQENSEIKAKLTQLDEGLQQSKELQKQLSDKVVMLNAQINDQRQKLVESKVETQQAKNENNILTEQVRQYQQQLKEYEDREFEISTALIDARAMAKNLVAQGRSQGEQERVRILESLSGLGMDLNQLSADILKVSGEVKSTTDALMDKLSMMNDTVQIYRSQLANLSGKIGEDKKRDERLYQAQEQSQPPKQEAPVAPKQPPVQEPITVPEFVKPPRPAQRPSQVSSSVRVNTQDNGNIIKNIKKMLGM